MAQSAVRTQRMAFHEAGHSSPHEPRAQDPVRRSLQRRNFRAWCSTPTHSRNPPRMGCVGPRSLAGGVRHRRGPCRSRSPALHSPRSWRTYHGASDFKQAVDLATRFNSSKEAVNAYLDWLAIVTRDEITLLWPHAETVAHALVREQTLTAAEIKALLAAQPTVKHHVLGQCG